MLTRRGLLAGSGLAVSGLARADGGRSLKINLLGYCLGDHVPTTAAVMEMLPQTPGFAPPQTARIDQMRTVAQTVIAGAAELGETDPIVTMSAVEAGADLKVVGLWYSQTSLVLVADASRIKDYKDLANPANVVAVNQKGDITQVCLLGPLLEAGIDINKISFVEIGGSGARMRALLAGRVQAVPVHLDQAAQMTKDGRFKVIIEPWKAYHPWVNEVWAVTGAWLKEPENEKALVALLKANIAAYRRANTDYAWYADMYRRYATVPDPEKQDAVVRPLWEALANEVKSWPPQDGPAPDDIERLIPLYKAAGAVRGTVRARDFVVVDYVKQALAELG
jgi:NitT/TauT family transport system substrate-binding protein